MSIFLKIVDMVEPNVITEVELLMLLSHLIFINHFWIFQYKYITTKKIL
jgi:hypothetical protein